MDTTDFIDGVATDGTSGIIGMILRLIYNRSTFAISTADATQFGAYIRDKNIADHAVRPVLDRLDLIAYEQQDAAMLARFP